MLKHQKNSLLLALPLLSCIAIMPGAAQADEIDPGTTRDVTMQTLMPLQQAKETMRTVFAAFDRLDQLAAEQGQTSGQSSGESPMGINAWVNPYYSHARDKNASTGYTSTTYGAFFGSDFKPNERTTVGMMFGIDGSDINSKVNGGGADSLGLTIAPYTRYSLNKNYSADFTFGYTTSSSDNERVQGGTRITGSSDVGRWFGAIGASANFHQNRWGYMARIGMSAARDHRDAFRESNGTYVRGANTSFGQAQIGGTVSYYAEHVRPWMSVTYAYDYMRKLAEVGAAQVRPSDDRDQVVLGFGATLFGYGNITGDLSLKETICKEDYNNTVVGLTLNAKF